jgi:hypothetical protein
VYTLLLIKMLLDAPTEGLSLVFFFMTALNACLRPAAVA